jgi:hypothetical protein
MKSIRKNISKRKWYKKVSPLPIFQFNIFDKIAIIFDKTTKNIDKTAEIFDRSFLE